MPDQFSRTRILLGDEAVERLASSRVAVFGIGGVGGYVCEALVRSGVGSFDLIDKDQVSLTNLNRQIIALHSTVGRDKAEVMRERMLDINPEADIRIHSTFFLPDTADRFPFEEYDYIVDAVDTVTAKIELILRAQKYGIPVISAMGAGNKTDPAKMQVADIYETSVCPLARVMRRELKKRGVEKLKVVYSREQPLRPLAPPEEDAAEVMEKGNCAAGQSVRKKDVPGSTAFVPAVCGMIIAAEVVRDLITV